MSDDTRPPLTNLFGEPLDRIAKPRAPTRSELKLITARERISPDERDVERAFMARQLVQCTLPHANPGDVPVWVRKNGDMALVIRPGWDDHLNRSVGYPFGSLPRLILLWLITEAVRTGERRIELGATCADFMRAVGLDPEAGGQNRRRVHDQMHRTFAAMIKFQQTTVVGRGAERKRWRDMSVAPEGELWWDARAPSEQGGFLQSWVELGEAFFTAVTLAPVPLDVRHLRELKKSPLAIDLYVLATYEAFTAAKRGTPRPIRWKYLMEQFGSSYTDRKDLKRKVLAALRKVQMVYEGLDLTTVDGGFLIQPTSKPAVAPAAPRLRPRTLKA